MYFVYKMIVCLQNANPRDAQRPETPRPPPSHLSIIMYSQWSSNYHLASQLGFPCQHIVDLRARRCRDKSLRPRLRFLWLRIKVNSQESTLSLKRHPWCHCDNRCIVRRLLNLKHAATVMLKNDVSVPPGTLGVMRTDFKSKFLTFFFSSFCTVGVVISNKVTWFITDFIFVSLRYWCLVYLS